MKIVSKCANKMQIDIRGLPVFKSRCASASGLASCNAFNPSQMPTKICNTCDSAIWSFNFARIFRWSWSEPFLKYGNKMFTWLIVFITISASPLNSKSIISTIFWCFIVRVNSTSRSANFWSSMLWQVILFNAYRRFVVEFSTKSIKLKPLQRRKNNQFKLSIDLRKVID